MPFGFRLRCDGEDHLDVLEARARPIAVQSGPGDGDAGALSPRLGIAEEDRARAREITGDGNVEQPAFAADRDFWNAFDRGGKAGLGQDADSARSLGDERVAVGQEGQAPWVLEAAGNDVGAQFHFLRVEAAALGRCR